MNSSTDVVVAVVAAVGYDQSKGIEGIEGIEQVIYFFLLL